MSGNKFALPEPMPAPGIDGTYDGSCVACLRGTDTGLAFTGEAEWIIAGMMMLGIPEDQATIMVSDFTGCDHGEVPDGVITIPVAVCRECASRARAGKMTTGFKVGLLVDGLPNYAQRVKS